MIFWQARARAFRTDSVIATWRRIARIFKRWGYYNYFLLLVEFNLGGTFLKVLLGVGLMSHLEKASPV